jgi:hypothetical protein
MSNQKCVVLDCSSGQAYVFSINVDFDMYKDDDGNFDITLFYDWMNKMHGLHLKESQCDYMISPSNGLTINFY